MKNIYTGIIKVRGKDENIVEFLEDGLVYSNSPNSIQFYPKVIQFYGNKDIVLDYSEIVSKSDYLKYLAGDKNIFTNYVVHFRDVPPLQKVPHHYRISNITKNEFGISHRFIITKNKDYLSTSCRIDFIEDIFIKDCNINNFIDSLYKISIKYNIDIELTLHSFRYKIRFSSLNGNTINKSAII